MNHIALFAVVSLLSLHGKAFSQDEQMQVEAKAAEQVQADLKIKAEELTERYQQKISQVDSIYAQQLKKIRDKAVKELQELQQKVATKDLDEAIRIRDIAREIDAKTIDPADQPTSKMQKLRAKLKTFERANEKLNMGKAPESQIVIDNLKKEIKVLEDTVSSQARLLSNDPFLLSGVISDFTIRNCRMDHSAMFAEYLGRKTVLRTHPLDKSTPCELNQRVALRKSMQHKLLARVSHHRGGNWKLVAKVNGQEVYSQDIGKDTVVNGWRDVEIDLTEFAGRTIDIQLLNAPTGWRYEHGYWDMIKLVSEN